MAAAPAGSPWAIHFFQRSGADDPAEPIPAMDFFESIPEKVASEINAILSAVAAAPPPSFSGGGKWEAMHREMAGIYEVRVNSRGWNYRLFCLLVRSPKKLGSPSIVCLDGLTKPARRAAESRDYERVRQFADEFQKHERVMQ